VKESKSHTHQAEDGGRDEERRPGHAVHACVVALAGEGGVPSPGRGWGRIRFRIG